MKAQTKSLQNPIVAVMEEKNISRVEMCQRTGLTYYAGYMLSRATRKTVPESVLKFFSRLGYNPAEIKKKYAEYRKSLQEI